MILTSRLPLLLASAKQASSVTAADQSLVSVRQSQFSSSELLTSSGLSPFVTLLPCLYFVMGIFLTRVVLAKAIWLALNLHLALVH